MSDARKTLPGWLSGGPLLCAAFPETPAVQKLRGAGGSDGAQIYAAAFSDAALEGLVGAGIKVVWLRFFSGLGLEFEKAEIERVSAYVAKARTAGLKAALSVQLGSLAPETLLLEEGDAANWLAVNQDGQNVVPQAPEFYRQRPCYNAEGFMRYMERVCGLASDCGTDLVHFDGIVHNPEPDTCRCPICVAAFRDFVRQQYGSQDEHTRQAGLARFGFNTFTHLRPPMVLRAAGGVSPNPASESPHIQEWIRFKAHTLAQCVMRLGHGLRKRNPECAIGADLFRYLNAGVELGWRHGIDYALQLPALDVVTVQVPHACSVSRLKAETPAVLSEQLTVARAFGVVTQVPAQRAPLSVADSGVFERQQYELFELTA
ncbi:MAG TPA: beta-galactosidase [Planctomycetota bacterium]|jgi:hypothetical protein